MKRALAIIDGEHYLSTVKDALEELPYEFVAAQLVGGTEKLRGGEDYGVPLVDSLTAALEHDPEVVVDLSDEPVLGPPDRLRLASRVLALGLPYVGADFRFDPPALEPFELPSIGIVGTGKRVGKTAVGAHAARVLSERYDVVVVAMGRGGPAEPEVAETPPTIDDLLALSRSGRHAASDYLEDAALAGVVTIGCRRAGGGLAGAPFVSNVTRAPRSRPSARRTSSSSKAAGPRFRRSTRASACSSSVAVSRPRSRRVPERVPHSRFGSGARDRRRRVARGDPRAHRRAGARGAAAPTSGRARRRAGCRLHDGACGRA